LGVCLVVVPAADELCDGCWAEVAGDRIDHPDMSWKIVLHVPLEQSRDPVQRNGRVDDRVFDRCSAGAADGRARR